MVGKFLRGAFVQFTETLLIPTPNVIMFQFNPESIAHSWRPAGSTWEDQNSNPLAISGDPGETFDFTLHMDSSDMIADGNSAAKGLAIATGIYTRLAALEMLMHPTESTVGSLVGKVSVSSAAVDGSASALIGGVERSVPLSQLPTVLFVWGPSRILPVKLTSLSVTETLYDSVLLHPIHAEARVSLEVLTPSELLYVSGPLAKLARGAYTYSQGLRKTLAVANLANAPDPIIGLIPT